MNVTVQEPRGRSNEHVVAAARRLPPHPPIRLAFPCQKEGRKSSRRLATFKRHATCSTAWTSSLTGSRPGPRGESYRQGMIRTCTNGEVGYACPALRACRNRLLAAEPYCGYCPNCHPTHPTRPYPACKSCGGRGWTTREAFNACRQSDREHILQARTAP